MNESQTPVDGVVISQQTVEASNENKRKARSMHQLPIYRAAVKLKSSVAGLYGTDHPRKLTRYYDSMLQTITEAKKCIGMATATHDNEERSYHLMMARVFVEDVYDDFNILFKLNAITKEEKKQMESEARSVISQCVAWQGYINNEGQRGNNG